MTTQDWINLMPIVADRGWVERTLGIIRDGAGRCPICALVHEISGGLIDLMGDANYAARLLNGTIAGAGALVDAADNRNHPGRPALMAALGMRDERAPSYEDLRELHREKRL